MKKQLLFAAILGLAFSTSGFAQEKDLKEKLKTVEGKPESIVVKTDKGTVTFDKAEAEELMKMLKSKRHTKKIVVFNGDEDACCGEDGDVDFEEFSFPPHKFNFLHKGGLDSNIRIDVSDFLDSFGPNKINKKVVIQNRDGKKIVTVTTKENGTEQIEMFEGKDAEKYIEEHKSDETKDDSSSKGMKKKVKKIVIEEKDQK